MAQRLRSSEPKTPARPRTEQDIEPVELLIHQLHRLVIDRFARLSGRVVVVIPVGVFERGWSTGTPESDRANSTLKSTCPAASVHPECGTRGQSEYCQQEWAKVMEQVLARPEVHWGRCKFKKRFAAVPVAFGGHCLAVCRLVSEESCGELGFERHVELLDVLVENFLARERKLVELAIMTDHQETPTANADSVSLATPLIHPGVQRSLSYIDDHLTDPKMTVTSIARYLDMNPSYLAHIFSLQMHVRMSQHIARKRNALAREFLTATSWQIKRIAHTCGYTNANWFSHLFHVQNGKTPTEFRNAGPQCGRER